MTIITSTIIYLICFLIFALLGKWSRFNKLSPITKQIIYGIFASLFCVLIVELKFDNYGLGSICLASGLIILTCFRFGCLTCFLSTAVLLVDIGINYLLGYVPETVMQYVILLLIIFASVILSKILLVKKRDNFLNVSVVLALLFDCVYILLIIWYNPQMNMYDAVNEARLCASILCITNVISIFITYFFYNILCIKLNGESVITYFKQRANAITGNISSTFRGIVFSAIFVLFIAIFIYAAGSTYILEFYEQQSSCDNALNTCQNIIDETSNDNETISSVNLLTIAELKNNHAKEIDINLNSYITLFYDQDDQLVGSAEPYSEFCEPSHKFDENNYKVVSIKNSINNREENYMYMYRNYKNYKIISFGLEKEYMFLSYFYILNMMIFLVVGFAILTLVIDIVYRKYIGNNLTMISDSLHGILSGDYNKQPEIKSKDEFAQIASSIDKTVEQFRQSIERETKRYAADFELAKQIQLNSLPHVFPPFPEHNEIDIYAMYKSAQQVGGDFYDYYFLDKNHLAFLIADVSGKGISAAMFMMKAKMAFMAYSETLKNAKMIVDAVNSYLCKDNEAQIFVTCWFAILDIENGQMSYVCAGHDSPMLLRSNSHIKSLKNTGNIMLGFEPYYVFDSNDVNLQPHDALFLFTDGITEAHNKENELFGKQKLKKSLSAVLDNLSPENMCNTVDSAVFQFTKDAEQFDDITMLALRFNGQYFSTNEDTTNLEFTASMSCSINNVAKTIAFFNAECEKRKIKQASIFLLDTIIDELLSNVIKYSNTKTDDYIVATMKIDKNNNANTGLIEIRIEDKGNKFNPLEHNKPNTSPKLTDKNAGGIGIHIAKKKAHTLDYKYIDDKNVLSFSVKF